MNRYSVFWAVTVLSLGCGADADETSLQASASGGGGSAVGTATQASSSSAGGQGGGASAVQASSGASTGTGGEVGCALEREPFRVTLRIDKGPPVRLSSCDPSYPYGPRAYYFHNDKGPTEGFEILACAEPIGLTSLRVFSNLTNVGTSNQFHAFYFVDSQGAYFSDGSSISFTISDFGDEHEPVSGHFEGQLTAPNMPNSKISIEGKFFLCRAPNEYAL